MSNAYLSRYLAEAQARVDAEVAQLERERAYDERFFPERGRRPSVKRMLKLARMLLHRRWRRGDSWEEGEWLGEGAPATRCFALFDRDGENVATLMIPDDRTIPAKLWGDPLGTGTVPVARLAQSFAKRSAGAGAGASLGDLIAPPRRRRKASASRLSQTQASPQQRRRRYVRRA